MRFPEFTGEWEVKKLGEVASIIGGGTPDTNIEEYWNGDIQWFTPTEIKSDYIAKSNRTISELGLKKSSAKLLPAGTILLTTRATIGEVAIATEECTTNQGFQSLVVNKDTNSIFISNWIKQNKNEFVKRANGSTFSEISKSEIEEIPILVPLFLEQTKIASFLSLIDERIAAQIKIIEGLKELKASLSKQIFSRKLRFKDENGNDFPEWVETKLGEIAETYSGGTPTSTNNSYYIGNIPFIKSGEISSDKTEQFINEEALKNSSAKMVSKGDLLLALYGATSGEVAISQIAGAINQAVLVIRTEQNTNYLHHFLRCNKENIISTYLQGGQGNLSAQIIKNIIIKLPSLIEQKKVANFLSKIDNKVEVETTTFDLLTKQKKYLLRQIFI